MGVTVTSYLRPRLQQKHQPVTFKQIAISVFLVPYPNVDLPSICHHYDDGDYGGFGT